MSRRRSSEVRDAARWAGRGVAAGAGWKIGGTVVVWLGYLVGGLFLAGWYWLSAQTGEVWLSLVVLLLLLAAGVALVRGAGQVARATGAGVVDLLSPPVPGDGKPDGAVYRWTDSYGVVRYDGSSGDLDDLAKRVRAPLVDPKHALYGKVRPGWELHVVMLDERGEAYGQERRRIDERIGTPGYENRRREGRGELDGRVWT